MTLVATWLRRNASLTELVLASDSRISGGEDWDACPKILSLSRPATAVAMSGDASEAYAFLLQAVNTCNLLDGHQSGRVDLGALARTLRKVFYDSRRHVSDLPRNITTPSVPDLNVVLVGWSWRHTRFEGYRYFFDRNGLLQMRRLRELDVTCAYGVFFFGDGAALARRRLRALIKTKELPRPMAGAPNAEVVAANAFLDWEPLEILLDVIGDSDADSVGGTPQVLRIYQYGQSEAFVWRDVNGKDYFGGRPVLDDERYDRRVMSMQGDRVIVSFSGRSMTATQELEDRLDGLR